MTLIDSVRSELRRRGVRATDMLILGVSGGVDSMTLLQVLADMHPKKYLQIVHVDHGIREDSHEDAVLVKKACDRLWVECTIVRENVTKRAKTERCSIEDTGRRVRYEAFEATKKNVGGAWIVTAHHRQDRAESTLMNIARGARLPGLAGLKVSSPGLLRPFAGVNKEEIVAFASRQKVPWREDATNANTTYLRNHLRHAVMPGLEKINPDITNALCELSDYAGGLKDALDELFLSQIITDTTLSIAAFQSMSVTLQRECIRCIYERAHWGTIGLSDGLVDELLRYILTARGGTKKEIGKLVLTKRRGTISLHML